jgi:hypothetical protein
LSERSQENGQGVIDEALDGSFGIKATGTAGKAALLAAMMSQWFEEGMSRLLR